MALARQSHTLSSLPDDYPVAYRSPHAVAFVDAKRLIKRIKVGQGAVDPEPGGCVRISLRLFTCHWPFIDLKIIGQPPEPQVANPPIRHAETDNFIG